MAKKKQTEKFADDGKIASEATIKACAIKPAGEDIQFDGLSYAPGQIEQLSRYVSEADELNISIKTKEPNMRIAAITCRSVKVTQCVLKAKGTAIKLESLQIPAKRLDHVHSFIKNETPLIVTLSLYQQRLPIAEDSEQSED